MLDLIHHNESAYPPQTSYLTIVRPTLEYAAMVWDPITQTLIQTLENVQRKAARFVINDYTSRTQGCVTS
jgi:hypothetical protein